jgi:hypothetical protein
MTAVPDKVNIGPPELLLKLPVKIQCVTRPAEKFPAGLPPVVK